MSKQSKRHMGAKIKSTEGVDAITVADDGNVGIGTDSPAYPLEVQTASGGRVRFGDGTNNLDFFPTTGQISTGGDVLIRAFGASGSVTFGTGTAAPERMRLDASGNLLVGTTSTANSTPGARILNAVNGPFFQSTRADSTNASATYVVYSSTAATTRFYVGFAGTVFATNTTITSLSDQRFKENIRDLDDGLASVMALKPRKFDWKEGKGKDIKNDRGFIAQEFEQVFPDLIDTWKDPAPEGEEPYKAVNANLIPTLVKAIQEQQAQIEALKAEVAALKKGV